MTHTDSVLTYDAAFLTVV